MAGLIEAILVATGDEGLVQTLTELQIEDLEAQPEDLGEVGAIASKTDPIPPRVAYGHGNPSWERRIVPEDLARQGKLARTSPLSDILYWLRNNKKWWMLPLVSVLLVMSLIMVLGSTGFAPYIYTLF